MKRSEIQECVRSKNVAVPQNTTENFLPDFAELVIGPATSGGTRWLHPGYASTRLIKPAGVTNTRKLAITMVAARK
jgi:hypothetical protein